MDDAASNPAALLRSYKEQLAHLEANLKRHDQHLTNISRWSMPLLEPPHLWKNLKGRFGIAYTGFEQLEALSTAEAAAKLQSLRQEGSNELWRSTALKEIERLSILIENFDEPAPQAYMYVAVAPSAAAAGPSTPHGAPFARAPPASHPRHRLICAPRVRLLSVCACARPAGAEPALAPQQASGPVSEAAKQGARKPCPAIPLRPLLPPSSHRTLCLPFASCLRAPHAASCPTAAASDVEDGIEQEPEWMEREGTMHLKRCAEASAIMDSVASSNSEEEH